MTVMVWGGGTVASDNNNMVIKIFEPACARVFEISGPSSCSNFSSFVVDELVAILNKANYMCVSVRKIVETF